MNIKISFWKLLSFILLIQLSSTSHAALISSDLNIAGDGLLTQDTSTNLEWLDITETINISFNDITSLLSSDPLLSTFRRASADEVTTLFMSAGINSFGVFSTGLVDQVSFLQGLMGVTESFNISPHGSGYRISTRGFVSDASINPNLPVRTASFLLDTLSTTSTPNVLRGYALSPDGEARDDISFENMGTFLVRACDPSCYIETPPPPPRCEVVEPSTISMLGFGMAGLALSRRKRIR